mmetsp:Transcript_25289/g.51953  ORF Transcript_25289/g.51953 Transcript_25289/m.51953 type:complete len:233 (+) Transcript_25289:1137-1835(+)
MTQQRSGTSSPRPATEVATMSVRTLFLKLAMASSRSICSLPPCKLKHGYPARIKSSNKRSHRACVSVKMRMCPRSNQTPSNWSRRMNLSPSDRTSAYCVMAVLATERPPTTISTGAVSTLRASASTFWGKVAENKQVWRSGRMFCRTIRICGSKPMSNMRSASSSTTKLTLESEISFPACIVRMSIMRPGVHTTISAPRFSSPIWSATPAPPYTAVTRKLSALVNFLASLKI